MSRFYVLSDYDATDSFDVEAETYLEAALAALKRLGYEIEVDHMNDKEFWNG